MQPNNVYIGDFFYEVGEIEIPISELDYFKVQRDHLTNFKNSGFETVRMTEYSQLELASKLLKKHLERGSFRPDKIDAIIFVGSNFGVNNEISHSLLGEFLVKHGLVNAYPLISSLSFCGNLLPGLFLGYSYIQQKQFENVLILVMDTVPPGQSRISLPNLAIGSDGCASCVLSKYDFSTLRIHSFHHSANARAGLLDPNENFLKYINAVKEGIGQVVPVKANESENITQVFMGNFGQNICKNYMRLLRVNADKHFDLNISIYGHVGAADICTNIADCIKINGVKSMDKAILLSSGPFTWGSALIDRIN